ncbi:MAG: hypothetical protein WD768_15210 [Phycisphaeraceae bacterium]
MENSVVGWNLVSADGRQLSRFTLSAEVSVPNEPLFVVQDCFVITGRGTVVTAQVSPEVERRLIKGMTIALRHESGFEQECEVRGVERFMDAMAPNSPVGILVSLQAVEIPEGSKAFEVGQPTAG